MHQKSVVIAYQVWVGSTGFSHAYSPVNHLRLGLIFLVLCSYWCLGYQVIHCNFMFFFVFCPMPLSSWMYVTFHSCSSSRILHSQSPMHHLELLKILGYIWPSLFVSFPNMLCSFSAQRSWLFVQITWVATEVRPESAAAPYTISIQLTDQLDHQQS